MHHLVRRRRASLISAAHWASTTRPSTHSLCTTSSSSSSPSSKAPSPSAHANTTPAIDGRSYLVPTLTLRRLTGGGDPVFATALSGDGGPLLQARARRTPIVLDLALVSSDGSPHAQPIKRHELRAEMERLRELGFVPVGITNASDDVKRLAAKMNLPYLIGTRSWAVEDVNSHHEVAPSSPPSPPTTNAHDEAEAVATSPLSPMVVNGSVRSGQQLYAQRRSLVILGNVNSGAEVLADRDIYVMGALKGRALAGLDGDGQSARICCQSFDAELVAIADRFTTCEDLLERRHKPTLVALVDDELRFDSDDAIGPDGGPLLCSK